MVWDEAKPTGIISGLDGLFVNEQPALDSNRWMCDVLRLSKLSTCLMNSFRVIDFGEKLAAE
jgi:hypothetical protein